jgi:AraC family transcriptional regulator
MDIKIGATFIEKRLSHCEVEFASPLQRRLEPTDDYARPMSSHIQLVERGHVIGLDGRPWNPAPRNRWPGFPCELHMHMRRGEVGERYNPSPLVFLRRNATGKSRIQSGQQTYSVDIAPGQVDVFPAGFQMDRGWWDCTPGRLLAVELCSPKMRELLPDEGERMHIGLELSGHDLPLAKLIECIRAEIDEGCLSGKLFADGLCLALLGHLQSRYSKTAAVRPRDLPMSRIQVDRIRDYVEAHLGSDLRIAQLADLVDLSPQHFSRLFKLSLGMTPHRYVLRRRVEAAERMLRTDATIVEIAYALGFSSQAHFTQVFRRYAGTTPSQLRSS